VLNGISILFSCNDSEGELTPDEVDITIQDIDGNTYGTIEIGPQIWIKENLKVTHYNHGDPIPEIIDNSEWVNQTIGARCDNDKDYVEVYGRLYNFYVVADLRNVCPKGWHVPSDSEWTELTNYLGDVFIAGGKLKEEETTHWNPPNSDATNSSGFSALPSSYRDYGPFAGTAGLKSGFSIRCIID